jgi:hypothetical protein
MRVFTVILCDEGYRRHAQRYARGTDVTHSVMHEVQTSRMVFLERKRSIESFPRPVFRTPGHLSSAHTLGRI